MLKYELFIEHPESNLKNSRYELDLMFSGLVDLGLDVYAIRKGISGWPFFEVGVDFCISDQVKRYLKSRIIEIADSYHCKIHRDTEVHYLRAV